MSELVKFLRDVGVRSPMYDDCHKAADEIERLRAALTAIQANSAPDAISLSPRNRIRAFHKIASDALEGK